MLSSQELGWFQQEPGTAGDGRAAGNSDTVLAVPGSLGMSGALLAWWHPRHFQNLFFHYIFIMIPVYEMLVSESSKTEKQSVVSSNEKRAKEGVDTLCAEHLCVLMQDHSIGESFE